MAKAIVMGLAAVGVGVGAYLLLRNRPVSFAQPMVKPDVFIPPVGERENLVVENRSLSYANQPVTNNYVTYNLPDPIYDPAVSNPDPTGSGGDSTNMDATRDQQPTAVGPGGAYFGDVPVEGEPLTYELDRPPTSGYWTQAGTWVSY